jgi:hypothetical protein
MNIELEIQHVLWRLDIYQYFHIKGSKEYYSFQLPPYTKTSTQSTQKQDQHENRCSPQFLVEIDWSLSKPIKMFHELRFI